MQDQPVVGVLFEFVRHKLDQLALNHFDRFARRDAGAVGDAEVVRIDCDGRLAEGDVEHHVGGLAANARQRLQRLTGLGHQIGRAHV